MGQRAVPRSRLRARDRVQEDVHGRVDRHRRPAPARGAAQRAGVRGARPARRSRASGEVTTSTLSDVDLAVDRSLSDIAGSFRFLLDVTPVDLVEARDDFWRTGRTPEFRYRPLADDPAVTTAR